jgi:HEAT repeat protein
LAAIALAALARALEDQYPGVRRMALLGLGEIGPRAKDSLASVRQALADAHPEVRIAAAEALSRIEGTKD